MKIQQILKFLFDEHEAAHIAAVLSKQAELPEELQGISEILKAGLAQTADVLGDLALITRTEVEIAMSSDVLAALTFLFGTRNRGLCEEQGLDVNVDRALANLFMDSFIRAKRFDFEIQDKEVASLDSAFNDVREFQAQQHEHSRADDDGMAVLVIDEETTDADIERALERVFGR